MHSYLKNKLLFTWIIRNFYILTLLVKSFKQLGLMNSFVHSMRYAIILGIIFFFWIWPQKIGYILHWIFYLVAAHKSLCALVFLKVAYSWCLEIRPLKISLELSRHFLYLHECQIIIIGYEFRYSWIFYILDVHVNINERTMRKRAHAHSQLYIRHTKVNWGL